MLKPTLLLAAAVLTLAAGAACADEPIRTLLLTGHNNHNWQYTSRVHAETLGDTGRFAVTISDDPAQALAAKNKQPWQLFVIDYNDMQAPKRWGDAAEKAFVQAVNDGAGVVAIHSADNAFNGWKEYEQMLGLMWREGTGHGKFHTFTVSTVDKADPIMAGLPESFQTTDELYHKLVNTQNAKYKLLAQAMSAKDSGGTGENEPMAFTLQFGKGRVFATPLGHVWNGGDDQKTSVTNPAFRVLLCRGAEWAATGAVTQGKDWKPTAADAAANTLTDAEKAGGWTLLFDGKTTNNFRGYKKTEFPKEGWAVVDGALKHEGGKGGGDIVTADEYDDFELMIDWRVAEGGNSGVIYRCTEDHNYPWETGPEMQVLDDAKHADGKKPKTRAGTLYDIIPCAVDVSRPAGEWNHARLVANGTKIQHWLNGFKVVDIDTASEEYKKAHAASKWPGMKDYNTRKKGHIDLQDHGDTVEFRNIKVRRLGKANPDSPTQQSRAVKAGNLTHGPFPGHCGPTDALVWARAAAPGAYRLWLSDAQGKLIATADAQATAADDLCMTFSVGALNPATTYIARVSAVVNPATAENPLQGAGDCTVVTAPPTTASESTTTIVFGSCTNDPVDREQKVWQAVGNVKPDAICLIGDTPYIDTTDLAVQRAKYGNLFAVNDLAALRKRGVVVYGVWDDHDFGLNDTDGRLSGKENSRKAFLEYHANAGGSAHAGDGKEGVYSSFRRGPVEVFLVDARWFSNNQTLQLLGETQWQWLLDGLAHSTAKYKLVTSGMVWNDSIRPDKTDYWGHYPKERQRLFDAVRTEKIPGVILVGGDVHRSRAFRTHPFDPTVATHDVRPLAIPYTLYEWTSSPLGNSVHEAWNVPGETLVWDEGNPHAFLAVKADAKSITATWIDYTGRQLFREQVTAEELSVPQAGQPCKPTAAAVPASRGSDWEKRHDAIVAAFAAAPPPADRHTPPPPPNAGRLVFLGDSITEAWSNAGEAEWQKRFAPRGGVNAGIGGDRTQHVLWRLDHGLLDAMRTSKTKLVVLMIGTNNSNGGDHNAAEIAEGVTQIVDRLTTQLGDAKVLVLGVFPRSPKADFQRRKVLEINHLIAKLDNTRAGRVQYLDIGEKFLGEKKWEGDLAADIMPDYLHLSGKAYTIWADAVEPKIAELLGER